jgi:hypothetical protein
MEPYYWDVFPKHIKVSLGQIQRIPLSIRGTPREPMAYESANQIVADITGEGVVVLGNVAGATILMVYDNPERTSVRHIQIEVVELAGGTQ